MKTTILAALLLALAACSDGTSAPSCDGATSISTTPEDAVVPTAVSCVWQCTTRDGHPVVLAWETYELRDSEYVLTGSETLAGFCLE